VSKVYSDVNYIFFKLLPSLGSGVLVHFHDIFYPFEYTKAWAYENRAWNEAHVLRAFLQPSFPDRDVQYLLGDFSRRLFSNPYAVVLERNRREHLDAEKLKATATDWEKRY
jgi:hypothetical protein